MVDYIYESYFKFKVLNDKEVEIVGSRGQLPKKLIIPETLQGKKVVIIGKRAFFNRRLLSVDIPNSVRKIKDRAFKSNHLKEIRFATTIQCSFSFSSNKVEKKGLKYIGDYAFADNDLENIEIPNSVTCIGEYAFAYNSLNNVKLSNSIDIIKRRSFCFNKIEEIIIPNSVKIIEEFAFSDNNLINVDIPENTNCDKTAFYDNFF